MKRIFQALAVLMASLIGSGPAWTQPGYWMPEAKLIEAIIIEGDDGGTALILIQGGVDPNYIPPSCSSPYNTLKLDTPKGRAMLATALMAYNTGRPVRLALQCIGSRPLVSHLWI